MNHQKGPQIIREDNKQYISIQEAVKEFGYSRRTIYYWMKTNKIKWKTIPSGRRYILYDSLKLRDVGTD